MRAAATSLQASCRRMLTFEPQPTSFTCWQCLRSLSTTSTRSAGHNKWSKTKHIKAVTDKKKMVERQAMAQTIAMYSRMYGEDVKFNPQLANAITLATKASVPKALIEAAVAKGQGRSTSGAQLEPMTLEVLMPPDIALLVDIETDNKNRSRDDLRNVIKKGGGRVGSTAFYFTKRGRAVFKPGSQGQSATLSDLLDEAVEHDAVQDIEELRDGSFMVWTNSTALTAVTKALADKLGLEIVESELVFAANEDTKVSIDSEATVQELGSLVSGINDFSEVKAIYANVRRGAVDEEQWELVEKNVDI